MIRVEATKTSIHLFAKRVRSSLVAGELVHSVERGFATETKVLLLDEASASTQVKPLILSKFGCEGSLLAASDGKIIAAVP